MSPSSPAVAGTPVAELYRRHAGEVFGYVLRHTGDRTLGEDLASETFARALQYRHGFEDRGRPVGAWLVAIARNLVRDHHRSAYQRHIVLDDGPQHDEPSADDPANPELALLLDERAGSLRGALRQLPQTQRECLFWRFFANRSVAETARLLGKNEPAVRALQHRAITRLRVLLADAA